MAAADVAGVKNLFFRNQTEKPLPKRQKKPPAQYVPEEQ
jgi:hypothetical protein